MTWTTCEVGHPDRLLRLAALLERDAANPEGVQFDLGFWVAPSDRVVRRTNPEPYTLKVDCGTTACAFGLAAISGEFKAEGLTFAYEGLHLVPMIQSLDDGSMLSGFSAAAQLFGINYYATTYLFDPAYYEGDTPKEAEGERLVAERIRQFAATGEYDDEEACERGDADYYDDEPEDDDRPTAVPNTEEN